MMRLHRVLLPTTVLTAVALAAACSGGGKGGGTTDPNQYVSLSGTAVDYLSGVPIGNASIRTVGLSPALSTSANANGVFSIPHVPINGYVILEVDATGYRTTLSPALLVEQANVTGASAFGFAAADATAWEGTFAVTETTGLAHLVGRATRTTGGGIGGLSTLSLLPLTVTAAGPFFLDSSGSPAPALLATSSNGGFAFFDVTTGNVAIQASETDWLFQPVATVAKPDAFSIVSIEGSGGFPGSTPTPTPTPGPVSFAAQVDPIFSARGCDGCHRTGNPPGGLRLDKPAASDYTAIKNLTGVINLGNPAVSLLLTKPLFEATPDHGGGNIFLTTSDPDYITILNWITQGANNN